MPKLTANTDTILHEENLAAQLTLTRTFSGARGDCRAKRALFVEEEDVEEEGDGEVPAAEHLVHGDGDAEGVSERE